MHKQMLGTFLFFWKSSLLLALVATAVSFPASAQENDGPPARAPRVLTMEEFNRLPDATPQQIEAQHKLEIQRFRLFNGCRRMKLLVASLDDEAADIGLSEERIKTMAESRLRAARLFIDAAALRKKTERKEIAMEAQGLSAALIGAARGVALASYVARACLFVHVNVVGGAFSCDVQFLKRLYDPILGLSGKPGTAVTWHVVVTGTHGGDAGYILQSLSETLDRFLMEYLRVNEEACGSR